MNTKPVTAAELALDAVMAARHWYLITEPIPVNVAIVGSALAARVEALAEYIANLA